MNLRISNQELRFRISKQELERLCAGEELRQTTALPDAGAIFSTSINPNADEGGFYVINCNDSITLNVYHGILVRFFESLPSREGLNVKQKIDDKQTLSIFLEVDIRTQKRKRN